MNFSWHILIAIFLILPGQTIACVCSNTGVPQDEFWGNAFKQSKFVLLVKVDRSVTSTSLAANEKSAVDGRLVVLEIFKAVNANPVFMEMRLAKLSIPNSCSSGAFAWLGDYMILYVQELRVTEDIFNACSASHIFTSLEQASAEISFLRGIAVH